MATPSHFVFCIWARQLFLFICRKKRKEAQKEEQDVVEYLW